MIVAAHQPNYLPWLGQFVKIASCDLFVFCDVTQYARYTYHNRVQVKARDTSRRRDFATWLSVPVEHEDFMLPIRHVRIRREAKGLPWYNKHLERLENYYRRAAHFGPVFDFLRNELTSESWGHLGVLNMALTTAIARRLGIETPFKVTENEYRDDHKAGVPVAIAREFKATAFVRGWGAAAYQDDQLFVDAGIVPYALAYEHAVYPQLGDIFIPGLSIIDALFNVGFDGAAELIRAQAGKLRRLA